MAHFGLVSKVVMVASFAVANSNYAFSANDLSKARDFSILSSSKACRCEIPLFLNQAVFSVASDFCHCNVPISNESRVSPVKMVTVGLRGMGFPMKLAPDKKRVGQNRWPENSPFLTSSNPGHDIRSYIVN